MIALVFYMFIVKSTHVEVKTWKAPYEFSSQKDCEDAGESFIKSDSKVRYFCDYVYAKENR